VTDNWTGAGNYPAPMTFWMCA